MTALLGAHTLGMVQCRVFRDRIYDPNSNIDPSFAALRQSQCPLASGPGDFNLAPLDNTQNNFDNAYFRDLVNRRGLLASDQVLFNNGTQNSLVRAWSRSTLPFFMAFAIAMDKMGNISPLTGSQGEIRTNCGRVN